ncbi:MAG: cytochrome c biogenesis protein CcsA [Ignavibacteriales bacterium]|nr:cytochrome c biogenesis protein CcsA [Ignavibacteriales bacterium]
MVASIILWMAFAAALVSAFAYHQTATKKQMLVSLARRSFLLMAAGVVAASMLLMIYILRHQFEYAYIWSYSSRDLPTHLLITTFWAGQEGSFMFWALCSTLVGFALLNDTRRNRIEYETMAVYAGLQAFLVLLLIAKSPFKYIWDAYPNELKSGMIPPDGRGLNPLLQNFWMIVHPPVLFLGFAAMAVPFSLALAALWKKTYSDWVQSALPWALFAAISLGAGLIIGGYWAYGVLGWGGWWGWDPVENSSLVPWIIVITLLHTLIVQKKTGKLLRTNFGLAILGFVLVIYSTFLTRSGSLGDASVHSFTDPGSVVYSLLVVWILTVTTVGFVMLAKRWKELRQMAQGVGMMTRESLISIGAAIMGASALIILFGTSWPLIANSTVEPSFYDNMNLPVAVFLGIILGLSLLVQWYSESATGLLRRSLSSLLVAVVGAGILFAAGVHDATMIGLSAASIFALAVNFKRGLQLAKQNGRLLGGVLSHMGLAMLFLGIIASGRYGQKQTASLPQGETKELLGYNVTYSGAEEIDGKYHFAVRVERNGSSFVLTPVMYNTSYNNSVMREPDYRILLAGDFYLEPVSVEATGAAEDENHVYSLARGEPITLGGSTFTFLRFDMNQHGSEGMNSGDAFTVGAVLEITRGKNTETIIAASVFNQGTQPVPTPISTKDGKVRVQLLGMNIDMDSKQSTVTMEILDSDDPHDHGVEAIKTLVVEASMKPFMSLVWIAAVFILGGMALSLWNQKRIPGVPRKSNGQSKLTKHQQEKETLLVEQQ